MTRRLAIGFVAVLAAIGIIGCARPAEDLPTAKLESVPAVDSSTPEDDFWHGLERNEIQLDQKLLVVRGSKGVIGCPYLDVDSFESSGEVCAIIPAIDTAGMLESKVIAATTKAQQLGIEVGMSGREALDKIR